jgi:hypothetical protein
MPNATVRANAQALPETTNTDRRSIMRTFLALTGAAATSTVWSLRKAKAADRDLVSLGRRIETLTQEREPANRDRVEAYSRFEQMGPKPKLPHRFRYPPSLPNDWNCLIDPPSTPTPISMEEHWRIIRDYCDKYEGDPQLETIRGLAERSGYAAAAARVLSIDLEIRDTAARVLEVHAQSLAGAKAQAIAVLALSKIRYGRWNGMPDTNQAVLTLSRAVIAFAGEEAGS